MSRYGLLVIGAGPAGVTAALRARELGASVAIVERGRFGGTCTNDGCVPTRVLAKAARLLRDSQQLADYGVRLSAPPQVDFAAVMARVRHVVEEVHEKKQLERHMRTIGIDVFDRAGATHFVNPYALYSPTHGQLEADRFLICAGGHARHLPFPGGERALTSSTIWEMTRAPRTVAVIGGGATGCQLASVFEDFGARVTLMDIAPKLLPTEDEAVSAEIDRQFRLRGITILTGISGVERIEAAEDDNASTLVYTDDAGERHALVVDAVIASVGWLGNTDPLNLAAAGVERRGSFVAVDDRLASSAPHIFAAGDITGRSMLVQSAGYQARIAVENALLSYTQNVTEQLVPHGGFTDPEYGGVGLTEAQARKHYDIITATVPYSDLDRAVIDDRLVGFCKLIVDRRNSTIVGAHVVGEHAVEIVSAVSAGMLSSLHISRLADLELAYPTFMAIIGLAARRIVTALGSVHVTPEWRELRGDRPGEWERSLRS